MFDFDVLKFSGGFNTKVDSLESAYELFSDRYYNIAVNSATSAADMIFSYLASEFGQLKITCPTLSFCSPAMMALKNGHIVEIVDVNKYLNQEVYNEVNMPVLYGGSTLTIKDSLVVDSAHNPLYKNVNGDYIFTSFFPTKPIKAFCGGMISVERTKESAAFYFYRYRNFGRDSSTEITQIGNKYYMDGFNAGIIEPQLQTYSKSVSKRRLNLLSYESLNEFGNIVEHSDDSSYYLGTLILNKPVAQELREKTRSLFNSKLHYPLLHKQSYFLDHDNCIIKKCNYSEFLEDRLFTLPISEHYESYQIEYFKDKIIKCLRSL